MGFKLMPTVLRADGYSFRIYNNDHPPPHVHVYKDERGCKVSLGSLTEAPELMDRGDMRRTEAGRAVWITYKCQELLLAHWRRIREQNADRG
jgi:hypothetical protein